MSRWLPPGLCHFQLCGSPLCITLKSLGLCLPVSATVKHWLGASRKPGKGGTVAGGVCCQDVYMGKSVTLIVIVPIGLQGLQSLQKAPFGLKHI